MLIVLSYLVEWKKTKSFRSLAPIFLFPVTRMPCHAFLIGELSRLMEWLIGLHLFRPALLSPPWVGRLLASLCRLLVVLWRKILWVSGLSLKLQLFEVAADLGSHLHGSPSPLTLAVLCRLSSGMRAPVELQPVTPNTACLTGLPCCLALRVSAPSF